jgi:hypothetical protein
MIDFAAGAVPLRKASAALPWRFAVSGALLLGLAAGGVWLWLQQQEIAARIASLPAAAAPAPDAALEPRLGGIEQRLAQLDQRLTQLEQRPPPAPDAGLEQRLAQLEQRPVAPPGPAPEDALSGRLQTLEQRLARAEAAISAGTARMAHLQAARAALEAGRPLGEIPGAPPALAKFANAAPPTEASLRLSFRAAASAAGQAGDRSTAGLSAPQRIWQQVQTLVTVQQGDKVVLGGPASGVLAQAQARLDVGDLAGAVAALDPLDPAAARAMAGWRAQAQALLDARAALTDLVRS